MAFWPGPGEGWFSLYPIVPWLGVTMLGMAFGHWIRRDKDAAFDAIRRLGSAALAAFVVVRLLDGFGNIRPQQTDALIGFLNTVKYPPAITFLLPALGLGLLIVHGSNRTPGRGPAGRVLEVFGGTPLFFYLLHLYLYAQIGAWFGPTSLVVMYGWWLAGLVLLYPACAWFARFKAGRPVSSIIRFL